MTAWAEPTLFEAPMLTPEQAAARGVQGLADAVEHSGDDWMAYAIRFMEAYCREHREVFADDVWAAGLARPESPRAFGQVMKTAIRNGWLVDSGQARPSVQSNHSLRRVYRSLLWGAQR